MKQLPLEEKKVKVVEMRILQKKMIVLRTQQQQHEEKVEELQGSVQEDEGPLRCNPSFQKQDHVTKKYINPSLT